MQDALNRQEDREHYAYWNLKGSIERREQEISSLQQAVKEAQTRKEQTEAKLVQLGRDHENQIAKTRNEVQKELLDQKREEEVKSRESRCDNST